MNDLLIDAFEFCRLKERRDGTLAVTELSRLAGESVDGSGSIRWSLQGGVDKQGYPRMELAVSGAVRLMCQRCLSPFEFGIESNSVLLLAADEKSADEIDALLDDESLEVIVGSREFNIGQLIEDEALLAIPLSPKHETCPGEMAAPASREERDGRESPFAVLKNLKK